MSFPLLGFVHRGNIIRKDDAYVSNYSMIPGGAETIIAQNKRCRVSKLSGEDEQRIFGNASGKKWHVVIDTVFNVAESDYFRLSSSSPRAPITADYDYRIIWFEHRMDDVNTYHHTSLVIEKEDEDS